MSSPVPGAVVEIDAISHEFRRGAGLAMMPVLRRVNLSVRSGEFVALIGPSGCGKSTLLNMVGGLISPIAGRIVYDGSQITGVNTDVGYMTQHDTLLPYRTLEANVMLPLKFRKMEHTEARN